MYKKEMCRMYVTCLKVIVRPICVKGERKRQSVTLGLGVNFLVIVPLSRYQSTELQRIFSKLKIASFDKEDRSED